MITELKRTTEQFTSAIVNIPFSKPAKIFFLVNDFETACSIFDKYELKYTITNRPRTNDYRVESTNEIEPKIIREIWKGFHLMHPKLISDWRYLLWEIDNKSQTDFQHCLMIYERIARGDYDGIQRCYPVYFHQTMRGCHFISLIPISFELWKKAVKDLRFTNEKFPALALRIRPNKYVDEQTVWEIGQIYNMQNYHKDTVYFRQWLESQELTKLREHYFIVNYRIDNPEGEWNEE